MRQSPITFASLLGLLFTVVLFPEQVNALCDCKYEDHECFPADGVLLKQAVGKVIANEWDGMIDGVDYGSSMSEWCTGSVTDMSALFYDEESFNEHISDWDVSSVKDMQYMFSYANSFNQNISKWNVSKVEVMIVMFLNANSFNQDISEWDVSKVEDMTGMFFGATSFNQDISKWNISKVVLMNGMFLGVSSFNQNLCAWKYKDFPYNRAGGMFVDSDCTFQADPVLEDQGPFCSDDCGAPSSTPSSNPSRSSEPSSQPSLAQFECTPFTVT